MCIYEAKSAASDDYGTLCRIWELPVKIMDSIRRGDNTSALLGVVLQSYCLVALSVSIALSTEGRKKAALDFFEDLKRVLHGLLHQQRNLLYLRSEVRCE